MNVQEITTNDGLKLFGQHWLSAGDQKGAVVLVHGLGEHIGRYDHVAKAFNSAGYAFIAFDLRGHGRSEGKRGHAPDYDHLLDDIFQALEKARALYPRLPLFLYGHSLGGNLALTYALKRKPALAGVIATAPLLQLAFTPPEWQQKLLRSLNTLNFQFSVPSGLDSQNLSRDANVVRTYREDPLTHGEITPRLATDMVEAGAWCMEHAADFSLPLLLIHGESDRITSAQATESFANQVGINCTLKLLPGVYHEPHNEPEKGEVLSTILTWLGDCV